MTVVEPLSAPLERGLAPELGAVYRDVHAARGVAMHLGTGVVSFGGSERVSAVLTSDGRRLPCDLVVVGAGVNPRLELARRAGLEVGDGIVVDERLRTSAPDVFAAGDVAAARHPSLGRHIRVAMEHSGFAEPGDELVVRGDLEAPEFVAFWLRHDAVVAGMSVNVDDVTDRIQALIHSGEHVDHARLANPDVALEELLGQVAAAG